MQTVVVLLALVALATVLGLVLTRLQGRVTHRRRLTTLALPDGLTLGLGATLLQFSTEVCSPCRATHTLLGGIASGMDDVTHVDVDLTHRPDLASRYGILQTPTTFILDRNGVVQARIGGPARRESVTAELRRVLAAA